MEKHYRSIIQSKAPQKPNIGDSVICVGSGRKGVSHLKDKIGKYLGPHESSSADKIQFIGNDTIALYSDEYEIITVN